MRKAILALALPLFTLPALATVPLRVPLQGVIRDNAGVTVVEDVFSVTFSLYDGPEAVDPVWTESWPADGVSCEDEPSASEEAPRLTAAALSGRGRDGDQDRVDMLLDKE